MPDVVLVVVNIVLALVSQAAPQKCEREMAYSSVWRANRAAVGELMCGAGRKKESET